ncbi:MAG TPA: PfkB family carbohydrate kinase [Planococcus sp. (in: firmicutes)]|nr:PfkB family carbohydrate kinase [Planococcus sp. (in: firmicutes)]
MNRKEIEVLELIRKNPYFSQQEMAEQLKVSRPTVANLISGLIRQRKIAGRAYILPEEDTVICIGGANVDRKFRLEHAAQMGTSNPASVSRSIGGVARNIAENLGRLGHSVKLMSIAGNDPEWNLIEEASKSFMNTELTKVDDVLSTGTYTAVLEPGGEMVIAMADMAIYDAMTPQYIRRSEAALLSASLIVADLNCPADTLLEIHKLAKSKRIPFAVIPVSEPKMNRLSKDLIGVTWLILNRGEAGRFLDCDISTKEQWRQATGELMHLGAEHVVITGGKDGVIAGTGGTVRHYAAHPVSAIVEVTGAGDAFSSGIIHSYLDGQPFSSNIEAGLANAAKTLQSASTVRSDLSAEQFQRELEELT